jgi:hypothetical protein
MSVMLTDDRAQEHLDALQLEQLQQDVRDNNGRCPIEVQTLLDLNLPGWREHRFGKEEDNSMDMPVMLSGERAQEHLDALQLEQWQQDVRDDNGRCPIEVQAHLDFGLSGWREYRFGKEEDNSMDMPVMLSSERAQEHLDALQLEQWQQDVRDDNGRCPIEVQAYLDLNLRGWREHRFGKEEA